MCQSISNDKETYLLYSKLFGYKRRIVSAERTATEALSQSKNPVMSFSAGKDSIVMLDIAVRQGFKGELIFFKYGMITDIETPKENIELLKYYADKYQLKYKIIDCLGEVDCWEQCGRFVLSPETAEEKRIFRNTNYDFIKKAEDYCKSQDFDLQFIGMRKSESNTRRSMLNAKGQIYQTKTRQATTCCPIANLTNEDIWAYIFSNNLKYLSIYDYPYIDRRRNRNEITMLYNDAILKNGGLYHYEIMYPDFFKWLRERYNIGRF